MPTSRYGWSLVLGPALAVISAMPPSLSAMRPALLASVSNVEPARTGGFGEMTCQQCHWENPVNDPSGQIAIDGVPDTYTPGEQYLITVTLARPGLSRAGFQLAAREGGINMAAGSNAGSLRPMDELAQAVQGETKQITYVQHTEHGTRVSPQGTARWTIEWTAPESAGVPVVFHVAANAANDDASPLGDFIYTATAQSR